MEPVRRRRDRPQPATKPAQGDTDKHRSAADESKSKTKTKTKTAGSEPAKKHTDTFEAAGAAAALQQPQATTQTPSSETDGVKPAGGKPTTRTAAPTRTRDTFEPAGKTKAKDAPTGASPDTFDEKTAAAPTAEGPKKEESQKKADEDWQKIRGKNHLAREVDRLLKQHPNDPEYAARLMQHVQKSGRMYDMAEPFLPGNKMSDESRQRITDALKAGRDRGVIDDHQLRRLANGSPAIRKLAEAAGLKPLERTSKTDQAVADVKKAQATYEEKKAKVDALNKKLADMLRTAGPGMTDAQKKKFIEDFRKEHQGDYDAESKAATELKDTLEKNKDELETAAKTSHADANAYTSALTSLAGSSQAVAALDRLSEIISKGGELADAMGPKKLEGALGAAIKGAQAQLTVEKGDPIEATKELLTRLKGYFDKGKEISEAGKRIADSLKDFEKAMTGPFRTKDEVRQAALKLIALGKGGPVGMGLASAGFASQVMAAGSKALQKEWATALKNAAGSTKTAAKIMAGSIEVMGRMGRVSATAEQAAKLAGRLIPALGVVVSAAAAWEDFNKLAKSQNFGDAVSLIGSTLSTIGAFATAAGAPPIGETLTAVGVGISAVGGAISDAIQDARNEKELGDRMIKAGVDEKTARTIAAHPSAVRGLDAAGLTHDQILQIVRSPNADSVLSAPGAVTDLVDQLRRYGATNDQITDALSKLKDADDVVRLDQMVRNADKSLGPWPMNPTKEDIEKRKAARAAWVRENIRRNYPQLYEILYGQPSAKAA
jgi:hypothetical protein